MEPRIGRNKARVAIGRKLLIAVWHIFTNVETDYYAVPEKVAATLFAYAYRVGVRNLPGKMGALQFTHHHMDRLGIGKNLTRLRWGSKTFTLPPSSLLQKPNERPPIQVILPVNSDTEIRLDFRVDRSPQV